MSSTKAKTIRRATASTIQDKFLVGYQGWFTCPGDGEPIAPGHHGWLHWFDKPLHQGGKPRIDLWPDMSDYSSSEQFPAPGLILENGEQAFLFSSRNPRTVQRHFHWMAEHSVDGVFLQRFASLVDPEGSTEEMRRLRDEVSDRVREAAELEGRVFAIMYDVSGVPDHRIQAILERDWTYLISNKRILDSPNYLREKGKLVVALWGFGFEDSYHSPSTVASIAAFFRQRTPGGVYLVAGTPAYWRTSSNDADRNPEFVNVWLNEFDAISPWTVGRFSDEHEADNFAEVVLKPDADFLKQRNDQSVGRKIDYIPVVFPGGSGFNLTEGRWGRNAMKRNGGRFFWEQIFNARRQGVRIMYGAMWDEYDEGTVLMPVVEHKRLLPKSDTYSFMALDEDGYDLPKDWYMRICGFAAEGLRSERRIHESFPGKELQDYWSTRPHYEEDSGYTQDKGSSSASGDSGGSSFQEWLSGQRDAKDEAPPPPYSLEAESSSSAPRSSVAIVDQAATTSVPAVAPASTINPTPTGTPAIGTSSGPSPQVVSSVSPPVSALSQGMRQNNASVSALTHSFNRQEISSSSPTVPSSQIPATTQQPSLQIPVSVPIVDLAPLSPRPSTTPRIPSPEPQGEWSQAQWPPAEWTQQPSRHRLHLQPPLHPQSQGGRLQPSPGLGSSIHGSLHGIRPSASSSQLGRPAGGSLHVTNPTPPSSSQSNLVRPAGGSLHTTNSTPLLSSPSPVRPGSSLSSRPLQDFSYGQPNPSAQPSQVNFDPSLSQHVGRPTSPYPPTSGPSQASQPVLPPSGEPSYGRPHPGMPSASGGPQFPMPDRPFDGPNRPGHYQPSQYPPQHSTRAGLPGNQPPFIHGPHMMPGYLGPSFPGPATVYPAPHPAGPYYVAPQPSPGIYAPYPAPASAPYFPTASPAPASGPLGFALTAADSLGIGGNTRKQIERVTQTGNKLLNKFL